MSVTKRQNKLAFVFGQPYQISLIFGSKAGAYPCETPFRRFPLVYALGLLQISDKTGKACCEKLSNLFILSVIGD
jgi:hypothetical protein